MPCARLSWPYRQLLSARIYIASYRIVRVIQNRRPLRCIHHSCDKSSLFNNAKWSFFAIAINMFILIHAITFNHTFYEIWEYNDPAGSYNLYSFLANVKCTILYISFLNFSEFKALWYNVMNTWAYANANVQQNRQKRTICLKYTLQAKNCCVCIEYKAFASCCRSGTTCQRIVSLKGRSPYSYIYSSCS